MSHVEPSASARRRRRSKAPRRGALLVASAAAGVLALSACTILQDAFQVGQREFSFETAAEAEASHESFRFQGFLPHDATDVRLIAQLDGRASVMRWTSPSAFSSEHCSPTTVTSRPEIEADWLPDPLPTEGLACSEWTVVRSGDIQVAWINAPQE